MDQSVNHLSFHNDDIVRCDAQSPVREVQKCQTMIYKKCLATCSWSVLREVLCFFVFA